MITSPAAKRRPCCVEVIDNAMNGERWPFCSCYKWTSGGTTWRMRYTPDQAGGSGPGVGEEGWTVEGTAWSDGEPEIYYDSGSSAWKFYTP